MSAVLKAPFPYFGGKSQVADLVWSRLGNPDNYVEPFAGSLATLLRRPEPGKIETVNDLNHFIVNFWRSVQSDRGAVTEHANWPVTEADLHARHTWLMRSQSAIEFRKRVVEDPDYCDPKFAGWWVWGQCCWIGGGWCDEKGMKADGCSEVRRPSVPADALGRGVHSKQQLPDLSGDSGAFGRGVNSSASRTRKRPLLNSNFDKVGTGVHATAPISYGRPQLGDQFDI